MTSQVTSLKCILSMCAYCAKGHFYAPQRKVPRTAVVDVGKSRNGPNTRGLTAPSVQSRANLSPKADRKSLHTSPQHLRGRAAGVTSDKQHKTASEARQSSCQGINVEGLKQKAMPAYKALSILAVEQFADQNAVLKCPVCTFVVDRAIELTCCASLYCCECIYNSLQSSNQCIECGATVTPDMLVTVHKGLQRVTGNFTVHCDFHQPALRGYPTTVQLSQLQSHVESCCYNPDSATGAPARAVNFRTSVSDVLVAAPSKLQGDVSGRLAGHLVKSLSDGPWGGEGQARSQHELSGSTHGSL